MQIKTLCRRAFVSVILSSLWMACGGNDQKDSELADHAEPRSGAARIVRVQSNEKDPDTGIYPIHFGLVTGPAAAQKIYLLDCKDTDGNVDVEGRDQLIRSTGFNMAQETRLLIQGRRDDNTDLIKWGYKEQPVLNCRTQESTVGLRQVEYAPQEFKFFITFRNDPEIDSKILFHVGCSELIQGMGLDRRRATRLEYSTMDQDYIHGDAYDISCINGNIPDGSVSFVAACQKASQDTASDEYQTYRALMEAYGVAPHIPNVCQATLNAINARTDVPSLASKGIRTLVPFVGLNFRTLDLSGNQISDLSGLSGLRTLTSLDLSNNPLTKVDELASLSNLKDLKLNGTYLTLQDLDALKTLNLTTFQVTGTALRWDEARQTFFTNCIARALNSNMPPHFKSSFDQLLKANGLGIGPDSLNVGACPAIYHQFEALRNLDMKPFKSYETRPGDPTTAQCYETSILNSLNEFEHVNVQVDLSNCRRTNFSVLRNAGHITEFLASGNPVTPGAACPFDAKSKAVADHCREHSFTYWCDGAGSAPPSDLEPKATVQVLRSFVPNGTNLTCRDVYQGLKAYVANLADSGIEEWDLSRRDIQSLEPLRGFEDLGQLNLSGNRIIRLDALRALKQLKTLQLQNNFIVDLGPLSDLTQLFYLNVSHNGLQIIQPINGLQNLLMVNLGGNHIGHWNRPVSFKDLTYLNISNNGMVNDYSLSEFNCLRGLAARGNYFYSIDNAFVGEGTAPNNCLTFLDLNNAHLDSIKGLSRITHLRHLDLDGNYVKDVKPLADLKDMVGVTFDRTQVNDCPKNSANKALNEFCARP